ncbi:MAG: hypothetical protein AAF990_06635 [Bacteroidota bacterium]
MKVDKPVLSLQEGQLERQLGQMAELEVDLEKKAPNFSGARLRDFYNEILKRLRKAIRDVRPLPPMTRQQKNWLLELASEMKVAAGKRSKELSSPMLASARGQLILQTSKLYREIGRLQTIPDPAFEAAKQFLVTLKGLHFKFSQVNKGKIPYTNPKNKKDLYGYIESCLDELEHFYRPVDDKIETIRRIKNNQLKQVQEIHTDLVKQADRFAKSIRLLRKDKAWRGFHQRIQARINKQLPQRMKHFEQTILPRLQHVSGIRHVAASELYYKSVRTLIDLERFNGIADLNGVGKVRKSRKKLEAKMAALQRMGERVIEGESQQLDAISSLWKRIDGSVKTYTEKLQRTQPKKSSHNFGWNTSLNLIQGRVTSTLKTLSKNQLGATTVLSSRSYNEAKTFFQQSDQSLRQLKTAATRLRPSNEASFKSSLHQLANKFRVAGRKELPISAQQHQSIKQQYNDLMLVVRRSGRASDPQIMQDFSAIAEGLKAGSVVTNQSSTYLSDASLVVTTPTQQQNELWVRIFPDDIHIHSHEEALTTEEVKDAQRYWMSWWAASGDHELELGAWRALLQSYGSQRAAWICKRLDPRRLTQNRSLFRTRPASRIQSVIRIFKQAADSLSELNADMDGPTMLDTIDGRQLLLRINQINRLLPSIPYEQAAFLQRAFNELHRLESYLMILQAQLNLTDPADLEGHLTEMSHIQNAFKIYQLVQERFQAIEPLDTSHYLDRKKPRTTFPRVSTKAKEWSQAPHSRVLPDRFVVLTMNGNEYTHIAVGNPLPERLNVGLDPSNFDFEEEVNNPFLPDADGNLQVDEGMRWMVDFEEAIRQGMGLKIPLTQQEAERGFNRVLAIGIKDTTQLEGQQLLEALIDNHHYAPEGMSILPVGMPTNNTSDSTSGFNSLEDDPEASYRVEMEGNLFSTTERNQLAIADGKRLADALGINPAVLQHLENSDGKGVSQAFAMHRSLWHATLGDYMESGWDYLFTYDNIERTYQFFKENVVARGILPSIRVGTQPYGILVSTAFSQFRTNATYHEDNMPTLTEAQVKNPTSSTAKSRLQIRFDIRLKKLLMTLHSFWKIIRHQKVKHAYNLPQEADEGNLETLPSPQQHFIEMLGLQSSSVEYFFRYGINLAYRGPDPDDLGFNVNFTEESEYGPGVLQGIFSEQIKDGYFFKSFEFEDEIDPNPIPAAQDTERANRIKGQFSKSRIFKSRYLDKSTNISGPIIDTQELSTENTLEKNIGDPSVSYIQWLLEEADSLYDILERNNFDILPSNSMLFMMLRQSLLLAYREAALNVMQDEGFFNENYRRLIGASDRFRLYNSTLRKYVYTSKWTFLFRDPKTFNGLEGIDFSKNEDDTPNRLFSHLGNGERSLADFLLNKSNLFNSYANRAALQVYRDRVDEVREAMAALDTLSTAELNQLLAEHMDVSSYRLDAWLLGLANRRLQQQRLSGRRKGVFLGAYGWLEDLRPGKAREEAVQLPTELRPKDRSPVFTDEDNEGFIMAPSINQAITAAVLRSGYTSSRESIGDLENQMAVNLSSRRVRQGLQLMEGVNNGQSLGAVLGFQFERGLHESYSIVELNRFIYGFRRKFPLVEPLEVTTNQVEDNPVSNVVDGYAMMQEVEKHIKTELSGEDTDRSIFEILTSVTFNDWPDFLIEVVDDYLQPGDDRSLILRAIAREIDRVADSLDALGDLVISESVYQVVQGNHVRAAAVVEALAEGKAPPELQFIHTPRTGVVVTHRVVMHFERQAANSAVAPAGWPASLTPRALAEPSLNNWLGGVFGPANAIVCVVEHASELVASPIEISMADLGLQPIDLIYMLGFKAEQGGSELEGRVVRHLERVHALDLRDEVSISFAQRLGSWTSDTKTVYELTPLILQTRDMLSDAKAVDAMDIMIPEDEPALDNPERLQFDDLEIRINRAESNFIALRDDAQGFLDDNFADVDPDTAVFVDSQFDEMNDLLFEFSAYGANGSIPDTFVEKTDESGRVLLKQLIGLLNGVAKRLKLFEKLRAKFNQATTVRRQVELLVAMGRQLFDKNMILLPHYRPQNKAAISQQLSLAPDQNLIRHQSDPDVLSDWLQNLADIRPGLYASDLACMLSRSFGHDFPDWQPVQFPYTNGDYWLGLEYPKEYQPEGEYLSLALFNHGQLTSNTSLKVGVIIDEWNEIIPARKEVTGLAFHYDQPDAQAPQNLLLAVNPAASGNWKWDNLVFTLNETLDLAKSRAVEPDHLEESLFAQVLPTVFSEVAPPQLRQYDDNEEDGDRPFSNPLGTQVVMDFADNLPQDEE